MAPLAMIDRSSATCNAYCCRFGDVGIVASLGFQLSLATVDARTRGASSDDESCGKGICHRGETLLLMEILPVDEGIATYFDDFSAKHFDASGRRWLPLRRGRRSRRGDLTGFYHLSKSILRWYEMAWPVS